MLPRQHRLVYNKDFEAVFKKKEKQKNSFLLLRWAANNLKISRLGFVVSNKISKKATVRNKIKRRLRNVIIALLQDIRPGYDVVIIVKPEIKEKSYQEVKKAVQAVFERAGLFQIKK